jgi:putative resolvase
MAIKLSEYAKENGISYRTAWRAFKNGKLANARQLPSGAIVVDEYIREEKLTEIAYILKRLEISLNRTNNSISKLSSTMKEVKNQIKEERNDWNKRMSVLW